MRIKTPKESRAASRYLVMPQHANDCGIAFGGTKLRVQARKELLLKIRRKTEPPQS